MAHFTFSQIKNAMRQDTELLTILTEKLQGCTTPQEATSLFEHAETSLTGIQDSIAVFCDIITGRIDSCDPDSDIVECPAGAMSRYAPDWMLCKHLDDGGLVQIKLDEHDEFSGRCPQCGGPVAIPAAEFFRAIIDPENHYADLDIGVLCPNCAKKFKEQNTKGGQE